MRVLAALALLIALVGVDVGAQTAGPVASVPPAAPLTVSEADRLAWERYVYMRALAEQQLENLRLRSAETLREEYAKLDERFRRGYGVPLEQLTVSNGVFTRAAPQAAAPGGK